jgi:hypothetical protein
MDTNEVRSFHNGYPDSVRALAGCFRGISQSFTLSICSNVLQSRIEVTNMILIVTIQSLLRIDRVSKSPPWEPALI